MRKWIIGVFAVIVLACAGGAVTPRKGQPCDNPGDVYAKHGKVLVCGRKTGEHGWTWQ